MELETSHIAYLGLGSNMGDSRSHLGVARERLRHPAVVIRQVSSIYRTSPLDYLEQEWFLNQVIAVQTALSPGELLLHCQAIENHLGRVRTIARGPRTIDIDLLFYDSQIIHEANLMVPHPRLAERKFVLIPMAEIAPGWIHPALGKSIRQLLEERAEDPAQVELV